MPIELLPGIQRRMCRTYRTITVAPSDRCDFLLFFLWVGSSQEEVLANNRM